jgi:acetoacetyl-CoA reductase
LGPVEVLVNNAGITKDGMFHKMTPDQWYAVINTNLNSLFNMTRPVWDGMRERKFGRVICISSINGQKGQMGGSITLPPRPATSDSSKRLPKKARAGITVNAICPGYIATDMVKAINPDVVAKSIVPLIPVGRLGEPAEIARAGVFSDEAGFITGSTLSANGGQYMAQTHATCESAIRQPETRQDERNSFMSATANKRAKLSRQ